MHTHANTRFMLLGRSLRVISDSICRQRVRMLQFERLCTRTHATIYVCVWQTTLFMCVGTLAINVGFFFGADVLSHKHYFWASTPNAFSVLKRILYASKQGRFKMMPSRHMQKLGRTDSSRLEKLLRDLLCINNSRKQTEPSACCAVLCNTAIIILLTGAIIAVISSKAHTQSCGKAMMRNADNEC